jgi:hypothetical protein
MIKNIRNISFAVVFLMVINSSLYAVQNVTVKISTVLAASICAASSYTLCKKFPGKIDGLMLVGLSSLLTATAYYVLIRTTPVGRIKRANALLDELARHTLARTKFENEKIFFDTVQDIYLTDDLPLISAYNHLVNLMPTMHYAFSLINKASAEVGKNVFLQEECEASLSRANQFFKNISDAIKFIRAHKDYLQQLSIYKENVLHEKQTIAQEQMAFAQFQITHAQHGNLLLKWLKALFRGKKRLHRI